MAVACHRFSISRVKEKLIQQKSIYGHNNVVVECVVWPQNPSSTDEDDNSIPMH